MADIEKQKIMRLYERQFESDQDKQAFIDSVGRLKVRLSTVDVDFRLYQSESHDLHLTEIWFYPDKDTMQWVRGIIDRSSALLTQFNVRTRSDTFTLCASFAISEED